MAGYRHGDKSFPTSQGEGEIKDNTPIPDLIAEREQSNLVYLSDVREAQDAGRRLAHVEISPEPPEELTIDGPARERAEEWITDLYEHIGKAEGLLSMLGAFVPERSIGASHIGSMGIKVGELREQIPGIVEQVREMDPGTGGDAA